MPKLKRTPGKLKMIPRLLIVCEGKVTEQIYFEGVRKAHHITTDLLRLELGKGDPKTLVDIAVQLKKDNFKKHSAASGGRYDEVWCVFDRDNHHHIPAAQQKASQHGVRIAFSNPCFELFLLLHFCDCNADLHRNSVRSKLKKDFLPDYDKAFNYDLLSGKYAEAKERTVFINRRSEIVNQIQSAPFCSVPDLVDQIIPSPRMLQRKNAREQREPLRR